MPGSAISASRMMRASWISLRERPASDAVGLEFCSGTLGRLPPILATSPRSCAASYSSARRRFASDWISSAPVVPEARPISGRHLALLVPIVVLGKSGLMATKITFGEMRRGADLLLIFAVIIACSRTERESKPRRIS